MTIAFYPDSIPRLKLVWHEVNVLLRDIANTKEQLVDKHSGSKDILISDIDASIILCDLTVLNLT